METTNMLKKYCGEEFAFYYLFLNNQIVTLVIPVFFSIVLTMIDLYYRFSNPDYNAKNNYTIWYGLFIAVLVTFFVEYWKFRERSIIF